MTSTEFIEFRIYHAPTQFQGDVPISAPQGGNLDNSVRHFPINIMQNNLEIQISIKYTG